MERVRSVLLRAALWLYNAVAFVAVNIVGWRNALWNEKKWTPTGPGPGTGTEKEQDGTGDREPGTRK